MNRRTYRWNNVTEKKLRMFEFRYSNGFSTEDCKAFIKTVPLYRYSEIICLEARIVVWLDGQVQVDVLDSGFHSYYSAWYLDETEERYPILKEVNAKLNKVLKNYGIKEIKDGNKNKEAQRDSTHPVKRDTPLSRV